MSKHTPTPWGRCMANGGKCSCGLIWSKPADRVVAVVWDAEGPRLPEHEPATRQADWEFIVRAVNSHSALVEALKGLMPFIAEDFPENFPEEPSRFPVTHAYAQAFIAAKKALALAESSDQSPDQEKEKPT